MQFFWDGFVFSPFGWHLYFPVASEIRYWSVVGVLNIVVVKGGFERHNDGVVLPGGGELESRYKGSRHARFNVELGRITSENHILLKVEALPSILHLTSDSLVIGQTVSH